MGVSVEDVYDIVSSNNSSTTNLSAGATFTGSADDVANMATIIVSLFANQTCTLIVDQSSNGINWDISDTYALAASSGESFSIAAVASYARIRVTNTSGSATTAFRLQTIYSTTTQAGFRRLGQTTSSLSAPVVLASDQPALNVNVLSNPTPTPSDSGCTFGTRTLAATTEVLLVKATYTEQTSNAQRSIVSSNAQDSSAGTGIRSVKITYYTSVGVGPFTEIITLNGTTAVNTVASDICYIELVQAVTAGSGGAAAGNITVKSATAGGGVVIKQLSTGDTQSLDAVTYVPAGSSLYVTGMSVGHNGTTVGSGARYRVRSKTLDEATSPLVQSSDFVRLYGQSSTTSRIYQSPFIIAGPAKVEIWVLPETSTSTIYYGSIDYFKR